MKRCPGGGCDDQPDLIALIYDRKRCPGGGCDDQPELIDLTYDRKRCPGGGCDDQPELMADLQEDGPGAEAAQAAVQVHHPILSIYSR